MTNQKKNITIVTFVTIFGIGLFVIFFNIFSQQARIEKTTSTPTSTTDTNAITTTPTTNTPAPQITKPPTITPPIISEPPPSTTPTTTTQTTPINTTTSTPTTTTTTTGTSTVTTTKTTYKDGTYSFGLSYRVPAGDVEKIDSTIKVTNDTITSLSIKYTATNQKSKGYQSDFDSEIQSAVVGKKISTLNLSSVGGASLTTDAFMKGIAQIQSQAKL